MTGALSIARKELRTFFHSPVAVIFLLSFLIVTVVAFFTHARFFARNLADVRPLFEALPLLLVFLVSTITMRQWAEEQRSGTLEVLLTLPVSTRDLVLGKFLAGMALVAIALALTFPIPLTVSQLGDLDWGPVFGGYLAALLLGSTYMAIGLCVSARTDNQVVALMVTLILGGALYLAGSPAVAGFFGESWAELLRAIGTGSRFESIERGVVDLRDLAYYVSLTAFFLVLNGYFLESRRVDVGSTDGRERYVSLLTTVVLAGVNVIALNVWLAPVGVTRLDLTEQGEYSISPVTRQALADLDEPLIIQGFFSDRTHPLLQPLVPQIRDLLEEYEVRGHGNVEVSFADPNADDELEAEVAEQYGIRSVPFRVADRHENAVVNAYFHILIRYGDQYDVLGLEDLVDVTGDENGIEVKLKSLEYDVTRSIRRVSQDFTTLDALFAKLPEPAHLTLAVTRKQLPDDLSEVPDRFAKVAKELAETSKGKLVYEELDPSESPELQAELEQRYGIQPFALDLFGRQVFYLHGLLEIGDHVERIVLQADIAEADLKQAVEAALRRATPGQLKSVGLLTEIPEPPQRDPRMPPQMQPPAEEPDYQVLERLLSTDYEVERIDLTDGMVPDRFDVVVVAKPGVLDDTAKYALDQYLMRGGSIVALDATYKVDVGQSGLETVPLPKDLHQLLSSWGVEIGDSMIMDPQNVPFPIPVVEQRGPFRMQRIELAPYPYFPDVRPDGLDASHPVVSGLPNITVPWGSPLKVEDDLEDVDVSVLAKTSEGSWLDASGDITPDNPTDPARLFNAGTPVGAQVAAVALTGAIPSYFADHSPPGENTGDRTLTKALPGARLLVIGSTELASDIIFQIARQMQGDVHRGNISLLQNAVDWAVEDTELLQIHSSGSYARTLHPLDEQQKQLWEYGNYLVMVLALGLVVFIPNRRRSFRMPPGSATNATGGAASSTKTKGAA